MPIGAFLTARKSARVPVPMDPLICLGFSLFFYEAANRDSLPYSCFHKSLESEYEWSPFVDIGQQAQKQVSMWI